MTTKKQVTQGKAQLINVEEQASRESAAARKAARAVIAALTTQEIDTLQQALDRGDAQLFTLITQHLYNVSPHLFAVRMPAPGEEL